MLSDKSERVSEIRSYGLKRLVVAALGESLVTEVLEARAACLSRVLVT
jgi:hypothetical protein